jgi:glycosyltransferase involved in cell wall biosynthesis
MARRILHLTPSVRMLGARQSLLQLARGLDRSRFEPVVVCPSRGGLADILEAEGVPVEIVPLRPWRKGRSWPFIPWTVARLRRIIRERKIDLLHCNEIYPTPYAIWSAMGRPVLTHVRLEATPDLARKYWVHRADRVLCVSEAVRQSVFEGPGRALVQPERAVVVYNGLDLDAFAGPVDAPAERQAIRAMIAARGEDFVLGQFGLLSDRKRHRLVLEALRLWSEQTSDEAARVVYLVIGDEGPRDSGFAQGLRDQARSLGLDVREGEAEASREPSGRPRAVFLTFRPDIARYYAAIDCCVLPSDQEGFGRVIAEAAAFGKPSLGSLAGGIPEVIDEGQTGWLFEGDAPAALLAPLREAFSDPAERARRGQAALARTRERFSLEASAGRFQEMAEKVLASRVLG